MSVGTCEHLAQFKHKNGVKSFEIIHGCYIACTSAEARKEKTYSCKCHTCSRLSSTKVALPSQSRLHACLLCVFIGCYTEHHIHEHAHSSSHYLAVDLMYGVVYCFSCIDYVYDPELETIARKQRSRTTKLLKIRETFYPWEPSSDELDILRTNPKRRRISSNSYIGLRGLLNLGNTCFMNCIVQALIHTPLLRDYFLADHHVCEISSDSSKCLACEMSRLFQEFYSGNRTPFVPFHLLQLMWAYNENLIGYEQQDAHEFFMSTLDILHQHCTGRKEMSMSGPYACSCIIDKIFTGLMQGEVICLCCKDVSKTVDPFLDISLNLGSSSQSKPGCSSSVNDTGLNSLIDCLERFTRPEKVDSSAQTQSRKCSKCFGIDSTLQLTLLKLPVVVTFYLKRFEGNKTHHKKINKFISFPQFLDMTPFTSSYRSESSLNADGKDSAKNGFSSMDNKYSLFAVVNHSGTFKGGHYTCFIRQHRDQWFKCDDDIITRAREQEVLESEGYLLFYHKQILEYE